MSNKNILSNYENREDIKSLKGEYLSTFINGLLYLDRKNISKDLKDMLIEDLIERLNYGQEANRKLESILGTASIYSFLDSEIDREKPLGLKLFDIFKTAAKISSLILYMNLLANLFSRTSPEGAFLLNGSWIFYGVGIPINVGIFKLVSRDMEEGYRKNMFFILSILGLFFIHLGLYRLVAFWGMDLELLEISRLNYILITIILSTLGRLSIKIKNP